MEPQQPIESAISDLQKGRTKGNGLRARFFDKFKNKYPNLHILYVLTNIIGIWSGFILIADSWCHKVNLLAEPAPAFSLEVAVRHVSLLMLGLFLLLLDDLSLKELLFGRKTPSEKDPLDMNIREKFFHNFKIKYSGLSTIYALIAIVFCWTGIWGLEWDIPIQPIRAIANDSISWLLLALY